MAHSLSWLLRNRSLHLGRSPVVMGILNVTPDSFSDGGKHFLTHSAVDAALRMEDDGAGIIDIGGESTRPYSSPVNTEDELRRVAPVLEALAPRLAIPLSIDTSKATVAQEAIERGASIINDVTGLEGDAAMLDVAIGSAAGLCIMHMQGTPQTMQDAPTYDNVLEDVAQYLQKRLEKLIAAGIERERICLDPGIGFGKTHAHNLQLLQGVSRFLSLGQPLLIGHSRKGFIGKCIGKPEANRMAGSLGVSLAMARAGVHILRVHDVAETVQALKLFEAAGGLETSKEPSSEPCGGEKANPSQTPAIRSA